MRVFSQTLKSEGLSSLPRLNDLFDVMVLSVVFTKALCQLMEVMCGPLLQTLENRLQVNLKRTAALEAEKETLEREMDKLTAEIQASK